MNDNIPQEVLLEVRSEIQDVLTKLFQGITIIMKNPDTGEAEDASVETVSALMAIEVITVLSLIGSGTTQKAAEANMVGTLSLLAATVPANIKLAIKTINEAEPAPSMEDPIDLVDAIIKKARKGDDDASH